MNAYLRPLTPKVSKNLEPFKFKPIEAFQAMDVIVYTEGVVHVMDLNTLTSSIREELIKLHPLHNQKCQITGEEAVGIQMIGMQVLLRPDILQQYALLGLSQELWQQFKQLAPKNRLLQSPFYTDGNAQHSKMPFFPESKHYIPLKNRPTHLTIVPSKSLDYSINLG